MENAIETIEDGIFTLEIFQDDCPESPMTWGWPVELLETQSNLESEDLRTIISEHGNIWYSQIPTQERGYLYIIAYKSDWIKAMKQGEEKARYHGWETTKEGMQKMVNCMADIMKQYYEGDIYGYTISCNGDTKESLWGIYGMDETIKQGKEILAQLIKQENEAIEFEKNGVVI